MRNTDYSPHFMIKIIVNAECETSLCGFCELELDSLSQFIFDVTLTASDVSKTPNI